MRCHPIACACTWCRAAPLGGLVRVLFIALLCSVAGHAAPLFEGADPHVIRIGGTYWLYPTEANSKEPVFAAYSSADMKVWKRQAVILRLADVSWIHEGEYGDGTVNLRGWAPAMIEREGRCWLYYSVGPQSPSHPSRIGVATGDSPAGPFRDSGRPLLTGGNRFEAIDPMVFMDPATGACYLYAGGSAGSTLRVFELEDDLLSFKREIQTVTPPHFTEGPFVHLRNGIYYLSYSRGRWNHADYSVHYATSASPTGPWTYRGKTLSSDLERQGPGHHSFVAGPDEGWSIVYHRWETHETSGPYRGTRKIAVARIYYDPEGLIKPVIMSSEGAATLE